MNIILIPILFVYRKSLNLVETLSLFRSENFILIPNQSEFIYNFTGFSIQILCVCSKSGIICIHLLYSWTTFLDWNFYLFFIKIFLTFLFLNLSWFLQNYFVMCVLTVYNFSDHSSVSIILHEDVSELDLMKAVFTAEVFFFAVDAFQFDQSVSGYLKTNSRLFWLVIINFFLFLD